MSDDLFDEELAPSPPSAVLLMEGPDSPWTSLAERIVQLGMTPVRTESVAEAERALASSPEPIRAALLPAEFADRRLKAAVRKLGDIAPEPIGWIAVGQPADRSARKHLRAAGVTLALWEPFDDETLRFQLNRAAQTVLSEAGRNEARVPSRIRCRVVIGERAKDGELYNLSVSGAFVKTPRASMNGANVTVEMRLGQRDVAFKGHVVFSNVVGNLQRPNLPLGMGVEFVDVPEDDYKALRDYVAQTLAQLEV